MKALWNSAAHVARDEPSSVEFDVSTDGQTLITYDGTSSPQYVSINDWGVVTAQVFSRLQDAVDALLPEGFTCADFPLQKLRDDFSLGESVFKQPQNGGVIDTLYGSIKTKLLAPGEPRHKLFTAGSTSICPEAADKWLSLEQEALGLSASGFGLSGGIPPRSFQFKGLLFDSTNDDWRNLFLVEGIPILGRPLAKQMDLKRHMNLWAIAVGMRRPFTFLVGIIRRLGTEILAKIGKEVPHYSSEIWVHHSRLRRNTEPWRWNGTDVDRHIEKSAGALSRKICCRALRQWTTAAFRTHLPQLFLAVFHSQGGLTSYNRCGRLRDIPTNALKIAKEQGSLQMAISEIWQAIHRLGPVDEFWHDLLHENHLFPTTKYLDIALDRARCLINSKYGIGGQDAFAVRSTVDNILRMKPFICGSMVHHDVSLRVHFRVSAYFICFCSPVRGPLVMMFCFMLHIQCFSGMVMPGAYRDLLLAVTTSMMSPML
jgi:hypothetical protein